MNALFPNTALFSIFNRITEILLDIRQIYSRAGRPRDNAKDIEESCFLCLFVCSSCYVIPNDGFQDFFRG